MILCYFPGSLTLGGFTFGDFECKNIVNIVNLHGT